jgi:hypothetical protein
MLLRRALVTAPLAVLVAIVAHALTFSDGHALAGGHGGPLLAVAVGGSLLCALVAFLSMAVSQPDARQGRRLLHAALPGGGRPGVTTAVLLGGGLLAFSAIEAAEGHVPLGSMAAFGSLVAVAAVVALGARLCAGWIAAAGALVAAAVVEPHAPLSLWAPARFSAVPVRVRNRALGTGRGRAPPHRA